MRLLKWIIPKLSDKLLDKLEVYATVEIWDRAVRRGDTHNPVSFDD